MDAIVSENGKAKIKTRRVGKFKHWDALINAALILAVIGGILAYRLPIFSNALYAPQGIYNFGTVKAGTEISRTFTVRNLHPWSIVISEVRGGCGCTKAIIGKDLPVRLAPMQSVVVNAMLNTSGRKGAFEQTIRVITDDNSRGTPLRLTGKVN